MEPSGQLPLPTELSFKLPLPQGSALGSHEAGAFWGRNASNCLSHTEAGFIG